MADPVLHENNREQLQRMLGVPMTMAALPQKLVEDCLRCQKAMNRCSMTESLSEAILLTLAYPYVELPKATPTKFGHLKEGHQLWFRANEFEHAPCEFIRVADPVTHTYLVRLYGEVRPVGENMLRESHPGDVPEEAKEVAVAKEELPADADTEEGRDEELEAQRLSDACDKLKEAFPKDTQVDVAIPGEAFFQGTICGHGTPKNQPGKVQVRPSTETGKSFRWVAASCITKTSELVNS